MQARAQRFTWSEILLQWKYYMDVLCLQVQSWFLLYGVGTAASPTYLYVTSKVPKQASIM